MGFIRIILTADVGPFLFIPPDGGHWVGGLNVYTCL